MEQYLTQLKRLKDYDERLAQERAARAYQEQERARLQVELFRKVMRNSAGILVVMISSWVNCDAGYKCSRMSEACPRSCMRLLPSHVGDMRTSF